ncbi:MAG: DEAD/DEAH box helicase [Pseudomonadota bacterium]|nr:DEAD/DEAH box helicase [Pseudomonadota bacterium]
MLPSLVIDEVRNGLGNTLLTQFEPSTHRFKDAIHQLIDSPAWMKGPYIQLGLPFVTGAAGRGYFEGFQTQFPGHSHQERAWDRIHRAGKSTLVATGTGSGKTECFLFPVLAHAAAARAKGMKGIKAIIVYPMNALADDQAERIAGLVHNTPAFAGLRVGLFVGTGATKFRKRAPGEPLEVEPAEMQPDAVISDKDRLRSDPPDILLTNYKMLDFMLIRPDDQGLWQHQQPDTLRHLVVDELHSFDGAQGTDLAMLIRRLRYRLKADAKQIICIGTSATLGDASDTRPLREYADKIFGTSFDESAVITETRQSLEVFLGGAIIENYLPDPEAVIAAVTLTSPGSEQDAVAQWIPGLFSDAETVEALVAGIDRLEGRVRLGQELKKHALFHSLLRLLRNKEPPSFDEVADRLQRAVSGSLKPHINPILHALLGLVSWARAEPKGASGAAGSAEPFLTVRLQLWIRELARLVATVGDEPDDVRCYAASDLSQPKDRIALPMIQCNRCRTTGWLGLKPQAGGRLISDNQKLYAAWFAAAKPTHLVRLYPDEEGFQPSANQNPIRRCICVSCGHLQDASRKECGSCSSTQLAAVWSVEATRVRSLRQETTGAAPKQEKVTIHDDACPVCDSRNSSFILGARTVTMAATAIERLWATPVNDDKKLIVFSDSVQDAAQRAGFLEAKTDAHLTRSALGHVIARLPGPVAWPDFLTQLADAYSPLGLMGLSDIELVSTLIPPDMALHPDWVRPKKDDFALPAGSPLPELIRKRLQWRAMEELTHLSDRQPTLYRTGTAGLFPDFDVLRQVAADTLEALQRDLGGFDLIGEWEVFNWAAGFIFELIRSGGILDPHFGLDQYAVTGGDFNRYQFDGARAYWLPRRGAAPKPRFVILSGTQRRGGGVQPFITIEETDTNPLTNWFKVCLAQHELLAERASEEAYRILTRQLTAAGIGRELGLDAGDRSGQIFGLLPEALTLHNDLVRLSTPSGSQRLWVPAEAADDLRQMPASTGGREVLSVISEAQDWWKQRYGTGDIRRVIAHEHTGQLQREERVALQDRFTSKEPAPWFENLISATPTLEMGIDIGDLSSVMLCGLPGNQASYLQRIGRAGRRDGNAAVFTMADAGEAGHDLYFYANPPEMMSGAVDPPAIFLGAAEVLRRQLYAFFFDHWVEETSPKLPKKLDEALNAVDEAVRSPTKFPINYVEFVRAHEPRIFDAFCKLLGAHLGDDTRKKLQAFLVADGDRPDFRTRFLRYFEDTANHRAALKKRVKNMRGQIKTLSARPQDEQRDFEIEALTSELESTTDQIKNLNGEHLLEAVTNAGLLPNYAFPEDGITLHTVYHRSRPAHGEYDARPPRKLHQYSRPAAAALSEFAPKNTFYAHKRKVEINQVDLAGQSGAAIVPYRLCANCHFLTPHSSLDESTECPKCGDSRWGSVTQRRPMLRLSRVIANITQPRKTLLDEGDESRKPRFYQRTLLLNHAPTDVKSAWKLESKQAIFGFEFIRAAHFHDINMGLPSQHGNATATIVANDDQEKPGFSLCGTCGMVQPEADRNAPGERVRQEHSPDCRHRHAETTEHLKSEIFLFRQFDSECIRVMVPQGMGTDEGLIRSFMAALQLGMRRRFGGKIDHLQFDTMRESAQAGGLEKHYVLIYDGVPGGTGYLENLLSQGVDSIMEVLATALQVLQGCDCEQRPELDGCYRCILQYGQRTGRAEISRRRAIEVLDELVNGGFERTEIQTIGEIFVNPAFGSELERRFLMALPRLSGVQDLNGNAKLPAVGLVQEVHEGKSAFLLTVGTQRYWVRQQEPIELPGSTATLCVPDFVITSARASRPMKPITIFVDGWQYHHAITDDDARKRSSLLASGQHWVWSVTAKDIDAALAGETSCDLDGLKSLLQPSHELGHGVLKEDKLPVADSPTLMRNAVAQLIAQLGAENADPIAATTPTARNLIMRCAGMTKTLSETGARRIEEAEAVFPEWLRTTGQAAAVISRPLLPTEQGEEAKESVGVSIVGRASKAFMTGQPDVEGSSHLGVILNLEKRPRGQDDAVGQLAWRSWLRLLNILQSAGLVIAGVRPYPAEVILDFEPAKAANEGGVSDAWNSALDQVSEAHRSGLYPLALQGLPAPSVIGEEVDDEHGYRMAEVLWASPKVVLLVAAQAEFESAWVAAGFTTLLDQDGWEATLAAHLSKEGT